MAAGAGRTLAPAHLSKRYVLDMLGVSKLLVIPPETGCNTSTARPAVSGTSLFERRNGKALSNMHLCYQPSSLVQRTMPTPSSISKLADGSTVGGLFTRRTLQAGNIVGIIVPTAPK